MPQLPERPHAGWIYGAPAYAEQIPLYEPNQLEVLNQMLQGKGPGFQNLPNVDFAPIAQQARTSFKTQTVPSIAERFEGMGSNRGSSGLIGSLGAAGAQLDQGLAALGSQYNLQSRNQLANELLQQLHLGLQPRNETIYHPEEASTLSNVASGIGRFIPSLLGAYFGAGVPPIPAGAAAQQPMMMNPQGQAGMTGVSALQNQIAPQVAPSQGVNSSEGLEKLLALLPLLTGVSSERGAQGQLQRTPQLSQFGNKRGQGLPLVNYGVQPQTYGSGNQQFTFPQPIY